MDPRPSLRGLRPHAGLESAGARSLHIGMLTTSLPEPDRKPGGVDVLIHRLANHLVDAGHRVTIFTYSPKPHDARYAIHRLAPARWRRRKVARMLCVPVAWNRLALRELDILHIHGDDWFYLRRSKPTVRTFYGSALDEMRTATRWRRRASQGVIFAFELLAARLATTTYGLIPGDGRWYRTIGHLGCGVDPAMDAPRTGVPTVLFVGTWSGRKRGRDLAAAFEAHVLPAMPEAMLVMASDEAPDVPWIEHLSRPTDEELRRRFAEAWVFCLPSAYEGFGIPYLEAMAAGTPVLATPNPGAEHLLGRGAHGMIVDLSELGISLRDLLADRDRRSELASAGRARARDFSWQAVCDAHVAAYEDAMARRGR